MGWPVGLRSSDGRGRTVLAADGARLIDAVVAAGMPIARACGSEGLCARCDVSVLSGHESLSPEAEAESRAKRRNRVDAAHRLACQCRVTGPVEITARYW